MAVYTKITPEFLKNVLDNYQIGKLIDYSGIKEGIENTNYLIRTTEGKFILTIFEKRVNKNEIPFFINLMRHLSDKNFICPTPLKDKNNIYIQNKNLKKFVIVSFLEGTWKRTPNFEDIFLVGKLIADLHNKTKDFKFKRYNSLSIHGWQKLIHTFKQNDLEEKIEGINKDLLDEINDSFRNCYNSWPKDLPKGLIHGDIFPDNVFFVSNKISGIIDFYFSCTDILAYEIAIALNAWCFDNEEFFNMKKAETLIKGYNSNKELTSKEINSLPILAEGAALRFLLTRLHDWFNTPDEAFIRKKNPIEYFNKLTFFKYKFKIENKE